MMKIKNILFVAASLSPLMTFANTTDRQKLIKDVERAAGALPQILLLENLPEQPIDLGVTELSKPIKTEDLSKLEKKPKTTKTPALEWMTLWQAQQQLPKTDHDKAEIKAALNAIKARKKGAKEN